MSALASAPSNSSSLLQALEASFQAHAGSVAVLDAASDESSLTFGSLWAQARAYQAHVCDGTKPGDIIPLFMERSPECLMLMLACVQTQRAFSCINTKFRPLQIAQVLRQIGKYRLIVDGPGLMALRSIKAGDDIASLLDLHAVKTSAWLGLHDKALHKLSGLTQVQTLAPQDRAPVQSAEVSAALPATCLFTSGSTGTPKGVLIAGHELLGRACSEISAYEIAAADRILNVLPWSFDVGLNQVLSCWLSGASLVLQRSWLPADIADTIKQGGISGMSAVPAIWSDLLASEAPLDPNSLRYVAVSGGSLPHKDQTRLMAVFPAADIIKTYGQTETFRSTIAHRADIEFAPASVGKAYGTARVVIVDEGLNPVQTGQAGEVVHTGPGIMLGYLGTPQDGKIIPNPIPSPKGGQASLAVRTGDFGHMDEDGRVFLKGRSDDLVKVQGNRVHLSEVEAALIDLPGIGQVQVLSLDEDGETMIAAALVASDSDDGLEELKIRRAAANVLPAYMVPHHIKILPALPRLSNGKTDRQALRQHFTPSDT